MSDEKKELAAIHDWPERIRDMALSDFDCQECGMQADDWRYLAGRFAALREIVEAVAEGPYYIDGQDYVCAFCDKAGALPPTIRHAPNCRVVKSRILLGWIDA